MQERIAAKDPVHPGPQQHQKIYTKTRPPRWGTFQLKNQREYVRASQIVEAIDFMVETFQAWLHKHVDVPAESMPIIAEELYSSIQVNYGHLFEVENG